MLYTWWLGFCFKDVFFGEQCVREFFKIFSSTVLTCKSRKILFLNTLRRE